MGWHIGARALLSRYDRVPSGLRPEPLRLQFCKPRSPPQESGSASKFPQLGCPCRQSVTGNRWLRVCTSVIC